MRIAASPTTGLKAKLFRGFADASRLAILEALGGRARCVGDIVEATGLGQSNVSNHLRCLADCGLVERERDGRHVYYALSDTRVAELIRLAEALLADVAHGVPECTGYEEREAP